VEWTRAWASKADHPDDALTANTGGLFWLFFWEMYDNDWIVIHWNLTEKIIPKYINILQMHFRICNVFYSQKFVNKIHK
jgi:hypothetical protein